MLVAFVHNGYAQTSTISARNTVYADFASKGAVYSINYDRVFSQGKKINISFRGYGIYGAGLHSAAIEAVEQVYIVQHIVHAIVHLHGKRTG